VNYPFKHVGLTKSNKLANHKCSLLEIIFFFIDMNESNINITFILIFSKKSNYVNLILLKGIGHPKMKILSSFTQPHVVSNPCEFLSSVEYKRRYFEECQ